MIGRGLLTAASLVACLAGAATTMQGAAVPVKAQVAQVSLEDRFERRLSNLTPSRHPRAGGDPSPKVAATGQARGWVPAFAGMTKEKKAAQPIVTLPTEGPVARLTVARLGVKQIVLAGEASHDQLAQGPTILKQGAVTVMAAHRDTHFLFIRDLRAGDEIALQYVTGETARYRVARFETVRWDQFAYPLDPARPLLALATCFPFDGTEYGGPWRRVAWAERIA